MQKLHSPQGNLLDLLFLTVIVATQGFDETIGSGLHVDEVGTQRAGAVEHQHDHGALVFVDDLSVA